MPLLHGDGLGVSVVKATGGEGRGGEVRLLLLAREVVAIALLMLPSTVATP